MNLSSFPSRLLALSVCCLLSISVSSFADHNGKTHGGPGGGGGGGDEPPANVALVAPGEDGLYLLSSNGSSQRLTRTKGRERDICAAWSPDGSTIAFIRQLSSTTSSREIHVISPDGSNQTLIRTFGLDGDIYPVPDTANGQLPFLWSPDGSRLLYTGGPAGNEVWALPLGGTPELVFNASDLLNDGAVWLFDNDITLSPDMDEAVGYQGRLAFSAYRWNESRSDLFILELTIDEFSNLTIGAVINLTDAPDTWDLQPAWHPSGTCLLYERENRELGERTIIIHDFLTSTDNALNPPPLRSYHYEWSPLGNYIAYRTYGFNQGIPNGQLWYLSPWDPAPANILVAEDRFYLAPKWNPNWVDDIALP